MKENMLNSIAFCIKCVLCETMDYLFKFKSVAFLFTEKHQVSYIQRSIYNKQISS